MNTGFKCIDTKPVVSFGVFFSAFLGLKCHYLRKKGWYKEDHCSVTRELSNNYILEYSLHGTLDCAECAWRDAKSIHRRGHKQP